MLGRINRMVEGDTSHPVTVRFSHAQALMPLAAFLGTTLLRMLHQEGEVAFAPGCRPWQDSWIFYELGELKRCYWL